MRLQASVLKILSFCLFLTFGYAQGSFQVGFWNIENLFDTTNAVLAGDDDFTPNGKYHWTEERLAEKCADLARVIQDINSTTDLALLGLAEIENYQVLDRLNRSIPKAAFQIVHKESPDERGIDCGLLYNPHQLRLRSASFLPVYLAAGEKTRDIIEAQFTVKEAVYSPTLYVFINHWPSRWGGEAETDPLRQAAAGTLRQRVDHILMLDPRADIIIMGDFNDYPDNTSLRAVLRAAPPQTSGLPGDLINTTYPLHQEPDRGTYVYRGEWGVLDQIIISAGLLDDLGFSWVPFSTHAFRPEYLLEKTGDHAGWPFRTYRGNDYQGGYSDHLPILCNIKFDQR